MYQTLYRKLKESDKRIIASKQSWTCRLCNELLQSTYQIDHIVPFSITHDDSDTNLQALCVSCHARKTQKEANRIPKFRKLSSIKSRTLCWFCLEELLDNVGEIRHSCSQTLHPIIQSTSTEKDYKKDNKYNNMNELDEYIHVEREKVLKVKITVKYIWVNNYFTDSKDLSLDHIAEVINVAVKNESNGSGREKYTRIEFNITLAEELGEETPDELVDFIHENLPAKLDRSIFKSDAGDITYSFII